MIDQSAINAALEGIMMGALGALVYIVTSLLVKSLIRRWKTKKKIRKVAKCRALLKELLGLLMGVDFK